MSAINPEDILFTTCWDEESQKIEFTFTLPIPVLLSVEKMEQMGRSMAALAEEYKNQEFRNLETNLNILDDMPSKNLISKAFDISVKLWKILMYFNIFAVKNVAKIDQAVFPDTPNK